MAAVLTIQDPSTGSQALIAPEIGFNCFRFVGRAGEHTVDVLDSLPDFLTGGSRPTKSGIPILFPFPNRIAKGHFLWEGKEYQLPLPPGRPDAIHGFCFDRPWRVEHNDERSATGRFQLSVHAPDLLPLWPADFILDVSYEVIGAKLHSTLRVTNPTTVPLPWGFGTHPYFKLPLVPTSDPARCVIRAQASRRWPLEQNLPSGPPVDVPPEADLRNGLRHGSVALDDVYTHLVPERNQHETSITDGSLTLVQTFGIEFRELVVFTPPERPNVVCLEPYTCTTNAINLEQQGVNAGFSVLAPGASFESWIAIEVRE